MIVRNAWIAISAPELPAPTTRTPPFPKLGWVAVLARMQLGNGWIELGGKVWDSRSVIGPSGHHHIVCFEPKLTGGNYEPISLHEEPIDPHTGSHREIEARRIRFEIIRDLVLGRVPEIPRRK